MVVSSNYELEEENDFNLRCSTDVDMYRSYFKALTREVMSVLLSLSLSYAC
jgi:hypothetical protein